MHAVVFNCDRCGSIVEGFRDDVFTAGYYEVGPESAWHQFAQDGEDRICDNCMWSNSEYMEIYGDHRG